MIRIIQRDYVRFSGLIPLPDQLLIVMTAHLLILLPQVRGVSLNLLTGSGHNPTPVKGVAGLLFTLSLTQVIRDPVI